MNKWIMFIFAVLIAFILMQAVDITHTYFHNRQYDVARIVAQWNKEWPLRCAKHRKELLAKGWVLEPRPELDKIIEEGGV